MTDILVHTLMSFPNTTTVRGGMSLDQTIFISLHNLFDKATFRAEFMFLEITSTKGLKWIVFNGSLADAAGTDLSSVNFVHVLQAENENRAQALKEMTTTKFRAHEEPILRGSGSPLVARQESCKVADKMLPVKQSPS